MANSRLTLEHFAEYLSYRNPFDSNRVTETDNLSHDVPGIHQNEFEELVRQAKRTCGSTQGRGVLVTGPPGIGKSHLLARFAEWARGDRYPFVYLLNLQAGPDDILRTILRASISILTKGLKLSPKETRLFRLVNHAIYYAIEASPARPATLAQAREIYEKMLKDIDRKGSIYDVLWLFFDDIWSNGKSSPGCANLACRWLSGDSLDSDEAQRLEISTVAASEEGCSLTFEQMKEVLKILCEFSGYRGRAFILCFDQVDTLNDEQVRAWTKTMHPLLDLCPNLLMVTSGVDQTFRDWTDQNLVTPASWDDRIRQFPITIQGIRPELASQMVRNRLDSSLKPFQTLPQVASLIAKDPLFPLGVRWWNDTLANFSKSSNNLRPRDVIRFAGNAWEAEARAAEKMGIEAWLRAWPTKTIGPDPVIPPPPDAIDRKIENKLAEHLALRKLRPEELPVDAGNVVGLLKSMLTACQKAPETYRTKQYGRFEGFAMTAQKGPTKPAFQLMVNHHVNGGIEKLGVTIADASSGNSATSMLKRVLTQLSGTNPPARALLVVDQRQPLKLAKTGQDYLTQLQALGNRFSVKTQEFDDYAGLDALEAVVGLARSGDLEIPASESTMHTISEQEVLESHHRNERYLKSPVICELIGNCKGGGPPPDDCPELDVQQFLEETHARLALETGLTTLELTNWWMKHRGPQLSECCRGKVHDMFKTIVLKLHEEGKVSATPVNNYYMVLPKHVTA